MNKVYVYGTLMQPSTTPNRKLVTVPGRIYDLGWFPGARLGEEGGPEFIAQVIEVTDERLKELDRYEGYYPDNPGSSLYIRRVYRDGYIYEYNREPNPSSLIESGDWQGHEARKEMKCA